MKKLILVIFICLNVFGTDKIEIDKNIVNLEVDEQNFTFDIKDVLSINKTVNSLDMVYFTIRFKGSHSFNIVYREPQTHNKLIELFKSYKMQ